MTFWSDGCVGFLFSYGAGKGIGKGVRIIAAMTLFLGRQSGFRRTVMDWKGNCGSVEQVCIVESARREILSATRC